MAVFRLQQAKLGGERETGRSILSEKKAELESEYKDIKNEYRKQLIKVKVGDLSNQDLEKYGKALDRYAICICTRLQS